MQIKDELICLVVKVVARRMLDSVSEKYVVFICSKSTQAED